MLPFAEIGIDDRFIAADLIRTALADFDAEVDDGDVMANVGEQFLRVHKVF